MSSTHTPPDSPDTAGPGADHVADPDVDESLTRADIAARDDFDEVLGRPRDPDRLGDYLDRLFVFAARRRAALMVVGALVAVGAFALIMLALRWDSDPDLGSTDRTLSATAPLAFEDLEGSPAGDASPALRADLGAPLSTVVVVVEGDAPREERIVTEPDPAVLPMAPGEVSASLLMFGGSTHVAVLGPTGWLDPACLQLSTVTADLRPIDAVWHDTPTGACQARGAGRQAVVSCVGAEAIVIELDVPVGEVVLAVGDSAPAAAVRVELSSRPAGYETAAVVATIPLFEGFALTDLPAARAGRGEIVTITPSDPQRGAAACQVQ